MNQSPKINKIGETIFSFSDNYSDKKCNLAIILSLLRK